MCAYHKVESSHEQDHVDQQHPMLLQSHLSLRDEHLPHTIEFRSHCNPFNIRIGLRQHQTPDNKKYRRASTKPEQRSPFMRRSINQAPRKDRRQKISKRIPLLHHPRENAPRSFRSIFQCRSRHIPIQPTHRNTKQRADGEELTIGLGESGAEFENDEEQVVYYEGPFAAIAVGGDAEGDGADGAEHEDEGDSPCDLCVCFMELCGEVADCQGHGEEVEGIPSPGKECNLETS